MVAPTGEQYVIEGGGYRAVVTEAGATLRTLEYAGRPLLDGFPEDSMATAARGQLLAPWPNRIGDGRYEFDGTTHQLPLSEPSRHNASHGLVRWASWGVEEHTGNSVSLVHRLLTQCGYPWALDLHVLYDLSADGLTVTLTATNLAPRLAPYATGAHPYLVAGTELVDDLELTLPAATRLLVDDRLLPVGRESLGGTDLDFRMARPIRSTVFDHAFTDLHRDAAGRATVVLRNRVDNTGVALWVDARHPWLQVYSSDDRPTGARRSLAVEPMTAPPDAFRSGEDLVTLAPAGEPGDEHSASWGIRALD